MTISPSRICASTFDCLFGERRHAGWDLSVNRNVGDSHFLHRGDEGAGFPRMPIEKPFALEHREVLHDRGLAGQSEMGLYFARAGSEAFFPLFVLNELKHISLPLGQHAITLN